MDFSHSSPQTVSSQAFVKRSEAITNLWLIILSEI